MDPYFNWAFAKLPPLERGFANRLIQLMKLYTTADGKLSQPEAIMVSPGSCAYREPPPQFAQMLSCQHF